MHNFLKNNRLFIIMLFLELSCYGQKYTTINDCTQKIIQAQVTKSIEQDLPVVFNIFGAVFFQRVIIPNDNIYYKYEIEDLKHQVDLKQIVKNELKQSLNVKFIDESFSGKKFILKAYTKNRMLLELKYEDNNQSQQITVKSLSNKTSMSNLYEDGFLKFSTIKKKGKRISDMDIVYDKLQTVNYTYQPTVSPQSRNCVHPSIKISSIKSNKSKVEYLSWDSLNHLTTMIRKCESQQITDSTAYKYNGDLLSRSESYFKNQIIYAQYHYDSMNQLIAKDIIRNNKKYLLIKYFYTADQFLKTTEVIDLQSGKSVRLEFVYNDNNNLISTSLYEAINGKKKLYCEFNFSYDQSKNIKKMWQINQNGKLKKEIDFVAEYIGSN